MVVTGYILLVVLAVVSAVVVVVVVVVFAVVLVANACSISDNDRGSREH